MDVNDNIISKQSIRNAIEKHNHMEMMEEISGSKKMEKVKLYDFSKIQKYMSGKSVDLTRMCFKTRCEMTQI